MKKKMIMYMAGFALTMCAVIIPATMNAQKTAEEKEESKEKLVTESKEAKAAFIKSDDGLSKLFKTAYGYVIFPNIGKGGLIVGGAGGKGTVYEGGTAIGKAKMIQVTVGAQAGGQSYREVIFFETKEALQRFKEDKLEFSGQVSAVAAKSGASANAKYSEGVLVFTEERGGLMVEASVGGQKFTYNAF
jgi:lipid-binding SYLF domain-containing protein